LITSKSKLIEINIFINYKMEELSQVILLYWCRLRL